MAADIRIVEEARKPRSMNPKKFALWLFMVSVMMLFGAWTSAYIVKRGGTGLVIIRASGAILGEHSYYHREQYYNGVGAAFGTEGQPGANKARPWCDDGAWRCVPYRPVAGVGKNGGDELLLRRKRKQLFQFIHLRADGISWLAHRKRGGISPPRFVCGFQV